jgi:hypothetical protein
MVVKTFTKGGKTYMLGRRPYRKDLRRLKLRHYLPKLPAPPAAVDHFSKVPDPIGAMLNDQLGDCVVAAAGHFIQSATVYARRPEITIPDDEIKHIYLSLSPHDTGLNQIDFLHYWQHTGFEEDKIEAYVALDTGRLLEAKLAIQYFGGAYLGLSLPDVNTFGPWTDPTGVPNPYNGHMIVALAYDDAQGGFTVATWGERWFMSYEWYLKYCDEAYALLEDLSIDPSTGFSPEGFDWAALEGDLAHLGDDVTPPEPDPWPDPGPDPGPAPDPAPVIDWKTLALVGFAFLALVLSALLVMRGP